MAEMEIIVQIIERIESHPNADRLEIAFTDTFDWPVIIGKDAFAVGDYVIHFPVDCVVSQEIEELLLGDSKLRLKNGRIRAAKIRGTISYGILAPFSVIGDVYNLKITSSNIMKTLGCKKYEPPVRMQSQGNGKGKGKKSWKRENRFFDKYFNMNHLQNCKNIFDDEDDVIITEKLHGTSYRAGSVERDVVTIWERIKFRFFSFLDSNYEHQFVYGSRNVQLQNKEQDYYHENVYAKMVRQYNLKNLGRNIVVYGEIVGPGIQKNYQYTQDHALFIYDVKIKGQYVNSVIRKEIVTLFGLSPVPVLAKGKWKDLKTILPSLYNKGSVLDPSQKVMEGIVIESAEETICRFGRKKVKLLNAEYLLNKTNTDFH